MSGGMWAEKYRPQTLDEMVNQTEIVSRLKRFVEERNLPHLLFVGPAGVGKTASVQAIARELDYDLLEVYASDYRTKNRMEELIGRAALQILSIFGSRRMILFDEMEGISGRQD